MKTAMNRLLNATFAFSILVLCAPAGAADIEEGIVLYVHSESATNAFLKRRNVPAGEVPGGRFAVVKLIDGAWGDASFALVWVPSHISIKPDDRVELEPTAGDLLSSPGTGVVTSVSPNLASAQ